jgi:polyisoprenoid-binding protein YceI
LLLDGAMQTFGPDNSALLVKTGRTGAVAKAGHDLTMEVTRWEGTVADDGIVTVTADSRSLKVLDGTGGMKALDGDDKRNIEQTIDDEVLQGGTIAFAGTASGDTVSGELDLLGTKRPITFTFSGGAARAVVKHSDFGMKPYSALFGTLKVADEVVVELQSR